MLRGDRERTVQRVRTVHHQACDTDEVSAHGGDYERVEHGGVQVFHRQPGCPKSQFIQTRNDIPRRATPIQ